MKTLSRKAWLLPLAAGALLPWFTANDYQLTVMATAYIFALATLGLNLMTGYTGQFNLAHGGFMAIGAYTVGILTLDYHVPFWIAFVLASVVASVLGLAVGLVALRLKGHYFSIFTLAVGYIVFLVLEKWDSFTHGVVGLIDIPAPPAFGSIAFTSPRAQYYLTFLFLVAGTWLMYRIVHSLLGRTFVAIRTSEHLSASVGINLFRNKLLAFILSVCYAATAGALYAGFVRFVGPDLAGVERTFEMTMFMVIGGAGTIAGPLLGAISLEWLTQSLQFLQSYRFVVFGPLLILLLICAPSGLVGLYHRMARLRRFAAATGGLPATSPVNGDPHA